MKRWIGLLAVAGCVGLICDSPVEGKDHSMAKSLIRTGAAIQTGYARACTRRDLLGNWELLAFHSPYRFRNPQAHIYSLTKSFNIHRVAPSNQPTRSGPFWTNQTQSLKRCRRK